MSKLTFEQRHRLESEVLPAVIDDPEYAASTIVRLESKLSAIRQWAETTTNGEAAYAVLKLLGERHE